jgi:hypothetical protein
VYFPFVRKNPAACPCNTAPGHVWLLFGLLKVDHPWSRGIQDEEMRTKQRDGVGRRKEKNRISEATRRSLDRR